MTRKEAMRQNAQADTLRSLGFTAEEAAELRRISMTLRRWYELECGDSNEYGSWAIERDETGDERPYMVRHSHREPFRTTRTRIADREAGAKRRLAQIMGQRNGRPAIVSGRLNAAPAGKLRAYLQTDPRGAALYILRPYDVPAGEPVQAYYNRGICVS